MKKVFILVLFLMLSVSGKITARIVDYRPYGKITSKSTKKKEPPLIPLLWIRGETEDTIRLAIQEVARAGNTGFILQSRPHPNWGGEEWWSDLRVVAEEAKKT